METKSLINMSSFNSGIDALNNRLLKSLEGRHGAGQTVFCPHKWSRVVLIIVCSLLCCVLQSFPNISFLKSDITDKTHLLHLQEGVNADELFQEESFQQPHFRFALRNYDTFRQSLTTFLTAADSKESFIDYKVVDNNVSGRLRVSIGGGIDYHTDLDSSYIHPYRRFRVSGNIYNRLLFWGDWWAGRFQGDLDYAENTSPLLQGWYKSHDGDTQRYTALDRVAGQISLLFRFGNVSIGRGNHRIGDTISGSTILNDAAKEYGYFSTEVRFGKVTLSFLHASFIPNETDPVYNPRYDHVVFYVDKYLVQHHINYRPFDNLNLYFGEQVIYANRGVDINYLLPHVFYRIVEHNQHDRDNVRIYAGGRWDVDSSVSLYGSLLLDELRKSEIFGNWWGNKYALQGGINLNYLEGLINSRNKPVETTIEVTAVRPWTYTHRTYMTNVSHDGTALGFPDGSNLVQGAAQIVLPIIPSLRYSHLFSFTRQGSIGNCWSIDYTEREKDTADWFEGEVTDTIRNRTLFTFSPLTHHSIKAGVELVRKNSDNWRKEFVLSYSFMY